MPPACDDATRRRRSRARVGGDLWRGDQKRNLRTNLNAVGGKVWMVTVTGPGDELLPRGPDGRVPASLAQEYNSAMPGNWTEINRRAQQCIRREGFPGVLVGYAWQTQQRGIDHLHLALDVSTEYRMLAAKRYVAHLRRLRKRFGFGYIDAKDRDGRKGRGTVMEAYAAAKYLSGYLNDSVQLDRLLARPRGQRPVRVFYVATRLSRRTGCTMRRLRSVRYLHMIRTRPTWWLMTMAGRHPAWMSDRHEHELVANLYQAPRGP